VILEKYRLVNNLLVQSFEDYLYLLKGKDISVEKRNEYVSIFNQTIDGIMA
jgi:hypothetical protein